MATPHSVSFHTLGCKLNFAETSSIRRQFETHGFQVIPFEDGADIAVINTCSVTDFADRKCRKAVRSALRSNPSARIVVVGCYAQLKPDEIAGIDGVDLVLGASQKFQVLDYIDGLEKTPTKGLIDHTSVDHVASFQPAFSFGDRTRSFLKVQDGCDYNCSFCTIPLARGKSRSTSIPEIVRIAHEIVKKGRKEIVLTGVNIGDFGHSIEPQARQIHGDFLKLLEHLDREVDIPRIRISSLEPDLCHDEIIEFVAQSDKFMPHFHMPLQSGNNRILKMMQRRYRRELYFERVQKIKTTMPDACIGADIIAGFPGESDEDFQITIDFLMELDISYIHAFTYSERESTKAASMATAVPMRVRRLRTAQFRELSHRKKLDFYSQHLNSTRTVLLENDAKPGWLTGYTDNYIRVQLAAEDSKINQLQDVFLSEVNDKGIVRGVMENRSVLH
ncbi:MAG: tRNA (N(6)-L-threonylcarbamoyladenosine(37)-C(2))-methylthiotransferase MtaB [Saprospiraceae bacterium]|nr:tRNA (N(6)-L-threonylcarbamoyladenosine(37)-C(2))-methylthiotransferase MtaB [Saprospiraceae bacterium]